jgi:hypothetical protein
MLKKGGSSCSNGRTEHIKELNKAVGAEKKAHRIARRAIGKKVKFLTLKLPPYRLRAFDDGTWQEGIPGDEFEAQCDFVPFDEQLPGPGCSWRESPSDDEEEEPVFILDTQGNPNPTAWSILEEFESDNFTEEELELP